MSDLTRRGFVRSSAGAAAGVTAFGALVAPDGASAHGADPDSGPVVAYITDVRSGAIAVMSGDREVVIHDRNLAAQIARVAR